MFLRLVMIVTCCFWGADRAGADQVTDQVNQWRQSNEQQIIDEFAGLLSIPNVAADEPNIRRNADHISKLLEKWW